MKENMLYQCEFCNTNYSDREEAIKCENNHKTVKGFQNYRYVSYKNDMSGKPVTIEVVFTNGTRAIYKR